MAPTRRSALLMVASGSEVQVLTDLALIEPDENKIPIVTEEGLELLREELAGREAT